MKEVNKKQERKAKQTLKVQKSLCEETNAAVLLLQHRTVLIIIIIILFNNVITIKRLLQKTRTIMIIIPTEH